MIRSSSPHHALAGVLATLVALVLAAAVATPRAAAMPPATELDGAQARAAERLLERAQARGVGELEQSAHARLTLCGARVRDLRRAGFQSRRALVQLRHAQRNRGDVRRAIHRVRVARTVMRRSAARRARVCEPTGRRARDAKDIEIAEGRLTGTVQAERPQSRVAGTGMVLALPIDFADEPARRAVNTPDRYEAMLFGEDYPHGGGSFASYWRQMSYGAYQVDGDVGPWRRMPRDRRAYADSSGGMGAYPNNSQGLLEDAVRSNDRTVDFGRYDNDGPDGRPNSGDDDGVVDSIFLVYAGVSAAESGDIGHSFWPHAWSHRVTTRDRSANGGFITVDRYAAVPERMEQPGPDGDLLTVGVAAHEYGHILGLPDLVDADHGGDPGQWDLMGSGVWGFEHSSRPTGLSAWSRARLGWSTPQVLRGDHPGHALGSTYARPTAVKLPIEGAALHEHFLVERRMRVGFDADLPGDGLLVWHVDDSIASGSSAGHARVELVASDGHANGNAGDLLSPGSNLSDSSTPHLHAHDGEPSMVAIQNIEPLPGTRVDLHAGTESLAPVIDAPIEQAGPQAAPPVATMTTPTAGARLRGTVTLTCVGTGNPDVRRVAWEIDGGNAGQVNVTAAPTVTETLAWDSTGVADGAHTLGCRVRNMSNQWSPVHTISVVVDNTAPAAPTITAPANGAWVGGTSATFSATGTDNYGVTSMSYRVDGVDDWRGPWPEASPQAQSIAWNTTAVGDGPHTLTVMSRDLAGNVSPTSTAITVNVDNAGPVAATPSDGAAADVDVQATTTSLSANWAAAGDGAGSGVASYQWRFCDSPACGTIVASGSGAGLTASATGLTLTDGATYQACVRAVDVVGNVGAYSCSDGVLVDASVPNMPQPEDGASSPDIDFQASTSNLDANWAAATDPSGIASYDWRFCTTAACGTVLASGSGGGLTASAGALALTDGSTYFACVRATDTLGTSSAWSCSDGVTVDTAAPTPTAPNDGAALPEVDAQVDTTSLAANWAPASDGTGSGVASYDWRFCDSPACGTVLASGSGAGTTASATGLTLTSGTTYHACIRAVDQLGNTSAYTCSDGVVVDSTAPVLSTPLDGTVAPDIDSQVSTTTLDANWTAANDGTGSGVASYDWRFCDSPACGTVVASGSGAGTTASATGLSLTVASTYYACVRASDVAGNTSAYTCSDGVQVDDGPPVMSTPDDGASLPDIDFQASTSTLDATWTAATDATGIAGYEWRFCDSPACGSIVASGSGAGLAASAAALVLSDGSTYHACARAQDTGGTWSAWSCSDGVVVDASAPTMAAPNDGAVAPDLASQSSTSSLAANWGAAADGAGSGVASYDWRFCDSPACGTIVAAGSGAATSASATGLTLTGGLTYYACVSAVDAVGNAAAYTCSNGVLVGDTPPTMSTPTDGAVLPDIEFQAATTTLDAIWAAATDDVGVTGYEWRFCDSPACGTILASGSGAVLAASATGLSLVDSTTYFGCVRAQDTNAAWSAWVCSDGVAVDTSAPVPATPLDGTAADIDSQGSTSTLDANWTAAGDGTGSGVASYDWRFCDTPACGTILASGSGIATTASATGLTLTPGATYHACVAATDNVGNVSTFTCSDGVTVTDTAPTMSTPTDGSSLPDLAFQASTTTLDAIWTAATDDVGVAGYEWRFCDSPACGSVLASGSGAGLAASATGLTLADATTYYACARAQDTGGQWSTWTCSDGVTVDTSAPVAATPSDGTAADIDAQASMTTLDANWTAAGDGAGSGTASYDWRFCDSPACGTVLASGSGAGTSASATGLSLAPAGTYYACVRAVDAVGNVGTYTCSDGVTVGDAPPTMSTPADGAALPDIDAQASTSALSANWTAATDDVGVAGYEWRFCDNPACGTVLASGSGAGLTASATGLTLTGGTTYYACARAQDTSTQWSAWQCSDGVLVDLAAPTTSHGGIAGTVSGVVNLTSSSSDAGGLDRVEYLIDSAIAATTPAGGGPTFNDAGTPFDTTTLLDGNHGYRVKAYDLAGNVTTSNPGTMFIVNNNVEAVAPTGTITSPANGATLTTSVSLSASVSDNNVLVSVEWLLDGAPISGVLPNQFAAGTAAATANKTWSNTTGTASGAHTLTARVTDASGNTFVTPGITVNQP